MAIEYVNGLPAIEVNGRLRLLASHRPDAVLRSSFKTFAGAQKVLPRAQWAARDLRYLGSKTKDQGQHGSCSGHASVKALDVGRRLAGFPNVELSSTFPYAQLNGGADNGASVSANMNVLTSIGTCVESMCGVDQIFKRQIPQEAYTDAKIHRAQEAYALRTFDDFGTALTLGYACAIGIMIGQNFARLDSNGVAPLPDVTVGGHALAVVGLAVIRNEWVLLLQNSWSESFGFDGGFCYITERHTYRMLDGFALVIPRESEAKGDDEPPPVPSTNPVSVSFDKGSQELLDASTPPPPVPQALKAAPAAPEQFSKPDLASLIANKKNRIEQFRNKQDPASPDSGDAPNKEPA